jgi:hypothetical protein
MKTIAATIGRELSLPTEEVPAESFGVLGTISQLISRLQAR